MDTEQRRSACPALPGCPAPQTRANSHGAGADQPRNRAGIVPLSRRHRQPLCRGAVLHPPGQKSGGAGGQRRHGVPGRRRTGGGYGSGGPSAGQQAEGLCRSGDEAGISHPAYRRGGRIQALLHQPGGPEGRCRPDRGKPGPEAGGALIADGELRQPVQPGQAGPPGPDDLAAGAAGGWGFRQAARILH